MGTEKIRNGVLHLTYLLGFLFYVHSYLLVYVNSSYLGQFISEKAIGVVFIISSIVAILGLIYAEKILVRYGIYKMMFVGIIINFLLTITLAISKNLLLILPAFIFGQLFVRILLFNLDVLLEKNTDERQTGKIRGIFLTITNIAVVISPFISGSIIESGDYKNVYLLSSIILIPILFLLFSKFRKYNNIDY
ncbi:MAG: MFS transporter, partial [Patescibacteria group bacterium]